MPVIVMTGEDTFKFINDGRPQQGSENYTYYASKEQAPEEIKALMNKPLDPSRDYREQTAAPAAAPTAASATSNVAPRAAPPAVPRGASATSNIAPRAGPPSVPNAAGAQGRFDPQTGTIKPSTANIAPRAGVPAVPGSRGATGPVPFRGPQAATRSYSSPTVGQMVGAAGAGISQIPGAASSMLGLSPGSGAGVILPPWQAQGGAPEPAPADLWRRMGGGSVGGPGGGGPSPASPQPTYDQGYVAPPSPVGQYARPPGYGTTDAGSLYSPPSGPMGSPGQQFGGGGGASGFGAAPELPSYSGYGGLGAAGPTNMLPSAASLGIQNFQIPTAAEGAAPPMAQILPAPVQQMQQIQGFQPPSFPGGQSAMSNPNYPYNPNWRR